ncbi:MAG: N-acetylglucosaminyldiphosphoundecaprenol N-acetyl-beta-D-mannosaminyltransferase [Acetobacteraceae bacterium]|jgi:N-acetylglucosaminyldiphosphoundecaprenol N-acetyl-beta-D-mannosaminyltransferase|nr:N-acetylglucosaminyldiphosphoundecaprenol N-acetyl-beta-D-mannosaminyltransferase [Acetobacteraceae bacterium]
MAMLADSVALARRTRRPVLGIPVDVLDWSEALDRIFHWAHCNESKIVCVCDVNSITQALRNPAHREAIASADMVTPDGAPVAWLLRRKGYRDQGRISGPDLMLACCRRATEEGTPMLFYGSTPGTLLKLEQRLRTTFPGIKIVQSISPPFRTLSAEEDAAMVDRINASGAQIIWVGLGCPKQEVWLRSHKDRIRGVMAGVGAALDFHAGVVKRAPPWMQHHGLEWCYRILQDPRRLAKRYLVSNSIFLLACFGLIWSSHPGHDA